MKKETVLSFSLGVIVGAAGMWALTPEQTTFEEGVLEYAPAAGEQMSTPENAAPADNGMQGNNASEPTSSTEAANTTASTPASDATADAAATASNTEATTAAEQPAASNADVTETAPAPLSGVVVEQLHPLSQNTEEQQPEEQKEKQQLASASQQFANADKKDCQDKTSCNEEDKKAS